MGAPKGNKNAYKGAKKSGKNKMDFSHFSNAKKWNVLAGKKNSNMKKYKPKKKK